MATHESIRGTTVKCEAFIRSCPRGGHAPDIKLELQKEGRDDLVEKVDDVLQEVVSRHGKQAIYMLDREYGFNSKEEYVNLYLEKSKEILENRGIEAKPLSYYDLLETISRIPLGTPAKVIPIVDEEDSVVKGYITQVDFDEEHDSEYIMLYDSLISSGTVDEDTKLFENYTDRQDSEYIPLYLPKTVKELEQGNPVTITYRPVEHNGVKIGWVITGNHRASKWSNTQDQGFEQAEDLRSGYWNYDYWLYED